MLPGARQREARASSRAVSTNFSERSIPFASGIVWAHLAAAQLNGTCGGASIVCLSEVQPRLDFPSIPGLPPVFDIEIAVRAKSFHHVGDSGHAPYEVPDVGVAASQIFPSENPWPFGGIAQVADENMKADIVARRGRLSHSEVRDNHPVLKCDGAFIIRR
jgi:hypothetical protein